MGVGYQPGGGFQRARSQAQASSCLMERRSSSSNPAVGEHLGRIGYEVGAEHFVVGALFYEFEHGLVGHCGTSLVAMELK